MEALDLKVPRMPRKLGEVLVGLERGNGEAREGKGGVLGVRCIGANGWWEDDAVGYCGGVGVVEVPGV